MRWGATSAPLPFQFTPLREGRHNLPPHMLGDYSISIHAPPRGATKGKGGGRMKAGISIHAPPRGATGGRCDALPAAERFQFTPLREGRRGALRAWARAYSFQFTPLREGRPALQRYGDGAENFNSRPSARGDHGAAGTHAGQGISIHAPPRGATFLFFPEKKEGGHFNSRPSARGDLRHRITLQRAEFQFTPLREGRRQRNRRGQHGRHFNSRPSARGDLSAQWRVYPNSISIHAPPRGATGAGTVSAADGI